MRTALIAGATGLVGKATVYALLESNAYSRVTVLVRKPLPMKHHLLHQIIVDWDQLENNQHDLVADDVYCCLGTTMRNAGSKEAFRKVDFTYPLNLATICLQNKASQYLLVSAMGANPQAVVFYNQVKGEIEKAITSLGFETVTIVRPSLLLGNRKEFRVGEIVAKTIMRLLNIIMVGPLLKYKAIEPKVVAKAMLQLALQGNKGVVVVENNTLLKLGS